MKVLRIMAAVLVLAGVLDSAYSQADSTIYKIKIEQYQSWQRTGTAVTITGAAVGVAGLGLIAAANFVNMEANDDAVAMAGAVMLGLGITAMVPGLIFRGIGKNKTREYRMKLDDLRAGFYYTPAHSGFVLAYTF